MRPSIFANLKMCSRARLSITGLMAAMLACCGLFVPASAGEQSDRTADVPKVTVAADARQADNARWKQAADFDAPGWLPGSVAHSRDGKTIVVGGTDGHVIAFDPVTRKEKWKTNTKSGFAAVAFSADENSVVVTFKDGVRFLDADSGKLENTFEEPDSRATVLGVFPDEVFETNDRGLAKNHKIIFGSARGYFVKTWIISTGVGTIQASTGAGDKVPADQNAVPLAVDPAGRSAIVTGPIHRDTGKNVLWAWVAGNYEKGSPGNRLLEGHQAVVMSAAWSKDGTTAATGDAEGRMIVWNAKMMQESHRFELGGRVAALALSPDGAEVAAAIIAKRAEFHVWMTSAPKGAHRPLHVNDSDFSGPVQACLAFSPDGRRLVGSASNLAWLTRLGELTGKLHIWESTAPGQ